MIELSSDKKNLLGGSGIGRRLMIYVAIFSSVITLLTTAVHYYSNYQSELDELDRQFAQIETSYIESIKTSLSRLDDEQLNALMNGILGLRDIVHIDVVKDQVVLSAIGSNNSNQPISKEYPLNLIQKSREINLGVLRVTASLDSVKSRLYQKMGQILINNTIIVFSFALFIFFFVQTTITKHLIRISEYAKKIDQAVIQPPLQLLRKETNLSRHDELDQVVHSIDEMQRNLHAGYKALTASEERLKNFAEAASDWLWEMDAELLYTYVSDRFFDISGFIPSEVINFPQSKIYEGLPNNPEWQQHQSDLKDRLPFRDFTISLTNSDSGKHWLRLSGRPIFNADNKFQGYRGTGTDITNEVRAREEAVETTLRFLDAIENVSDGIAFWDADDKFVLCNRIFRSQAGEAAYLLARGTSFEDYMRGLLATGVINKSIDEQEEWLRYRVSERKAQTLPIEVYRDGKWLLIRDGRASDGSTVSVTTDITEVKQREQQLELVTDAVPILLAYVDNQLHYQLINKEFEEWFNVSRNHIDGMSIADNVDSETYQRISPHIKTVLRGQFVRFQFSIPILGKGNLPKSTIRHVEASFTPSFDRNEEVSGFYVAAIDISELIEAEEGARIGQQALTEQTQILHASFDAIDQGICVWDEDMDLTAWNNSFEQFIGFPEGFLQRGLSLEAVTAKAAEQGVLSQRFPEQKETEWINRIHSKIGLFVNSEIELTDGRLITVHRFNMPDGGFVSTFTDVTDNVRAQEQLQHTLKIEAIGQLTGGVAHDFNNLLAIIIGSLNLLDDRITDERSKKLVNAASRASKRGAELTQRLLAFGRRQALISEMSNANDLVKSIFELLTRTLGTTIEVKSSLGNDLWGMKIDRGQLENALLNLAINARDAMPDGGSLTIETANILLGKDYAMQHQDVEPGAYVMIAVSDTGIGMLPAIVERVIEPFFTTKKVGAGSGLGLSMIHGFVNQSGGHMNIYSELNHGTIVRIYLPATEGEISHTEPSLENSNYKSNGEHILVIEDDPDVRLTTVSILSKLGYQVTEAADELQALAALDNGKHIDLVFSDVFLQGSKNGPAIVKNIRIRMPNMKILFTSGYAADQFSDENFQPDTMEFIPKPFGIINLSKKLREILSNNI